MGMNKILALFIFTMFVYFKNRKRIGDGLRLYRLRRPILRNQPHQHSWQTMLQRKPYSWYHPLFLRKYQHIFQQHLNQPNNLPQLGHELSNSSRLQNLNQVPVSLEINDSTLTSHMPRSNLQKGLELYLANIKKTEEERKKEQFWKEFKLQLYKDIKLNQIFWEDEESIKTEENDLLEQRKENSFELYNYSDNLVHSKSSNSIASTPRHNKLQQIFESSSKSSDSTNESIPHSLQKSKSSNVTNEQKKISNQLAFKVSRGSTGVFSNGVFSDSGHSEPINKHSKESTGPGFVQPEAFKTGSSSTYFSNYPYMDNYGKPTSKKSTRKY